MGNRKQRARAKKAARSLPRYLQDVAFSLASNRVRPKLGKFGPASEVRRIDPATGEVIPPVRGGEG